MTQPAHLTSSTIPLTIRQADWHTSEDQKQLQHIRQVVFLEEQNIPKADEWDGKDEQDTTQHYLAFAPKNKAAIACIRVLRVNTENTSYWKIGRVAVLPAYRGKRIAQHFIATIIDIAKEQGVKQLTLESQTYITSLYEKLGFEVCSEPFIDAGIEHVKMRQHI